MRRRPASLTRVDDRVRRDKVVAPTPLKVSQWTLSGREKLALACQVSRRSGELLPPWPSCGTLTVRRPTGSQAAAAGGGSVVSVLIPDWPSWKRRVHVRRSALVPGTHASSLWSLAQSARRTEPDRTRKIPGLSRDAKHVFFFLFFSKVSALVL